MKSLKIGNIKLKNPLLLAPMVDVTDLPYRLICRKAGASLAYTEMLYISQILHTNKKTQELMKTSSLDKPVGLQITGNSIEEFKKVIPHLKPFDLVDINCGCPSLRITGNQAGSYLLKNPNKIASMIKILKTSNIPVTAKIRLGFKTNNVLKVAKIIEKAGADAITIHARLAIQGRSIPADWNEIKKVRKSIGIPIIGNGDIFNGKDAEKMLDIADGVMLARSAIGDPLIFTRILKYLKTKKEPEFNFNNNIKQFQSYIKLSKKYNLIDIQRIKYLGSNFIKNTRNASSLRNIFMKLKTFDEIQDFVDNLEN
ncbi:MAG: tRNA-dihydrouridine synthase family protein [Nanoarchaeota archaeon]|nr:tRNA-dihydrouridine synthase family protein [Nanoarchaeota archaeon]